MPEDPYRAEPLARSEPQPITVGRYLLHRQIARGGMATIHIARLMGDEGFSRIVAAKRLLPEFAEDAEFVAMFLDEARIASKVHHRNVVPVLDVVSTGEEAILVQEYVHGAPLHWLLRTVRQHKAKIPIDIAVSIACQVLAGLHAAHETLDEMGIPLHIVHRDVSPQNVMIAVDGTARLLDFGVAKASMAAHVTREGQFKGKLAYSAPEQLRGRATRQSDIYSLTVLLWELIVGHRMHQSAQAEVELVATIMNGQLPRMTEALAAEREAIGPDRWRDLLALEPILATGLAVDVTERWVTAADMEHALIDVVRPATLGEVAAWLKAQGKEFIDKHDRVLAEEEASWRRVSSTVQRRIAALPGEVRRAAQGSYTGDANAPRSPPRPIVASRRFGSNALIALLCVLVITLAVGIVFAVRGPSGRTVSAEPLAPGAVPASDPAVAPTPDKLSPSAPVSPPLPSVAAPDNRAAPRVEPATPGTPAPEPGIDLHITGPEPTRIQTGPARTRSVPGQRPGAAGKRVPSATSTPTAPPPAAPTADPEPDCNPPYYYEGSKKIFKPNCI
jgi:eukaryotic-like serine/threonine-protein kinase